jgi:predicted transcriptional regulator of viral defense system
MKAKSTTLSYAKTEIVRVLDRQHRRVFRRAEIASLFATHREAWQIASSATSTEFLKFLLEKTALRTVRLQFPGSAFTRFVWGQCDPLAVVQSLRDNGYFTHFTAMRLHGLTEQIPKVIYFNFEQSHTGGGSELTQEGIDRAFRLAPRVSRSVAQFGDLRIYQLNGRNTGKLGVVDASTSDEQQIRVTNIERTLIDATVRPAYAGGVAEVLSAFRRAAPQVSVNKLVAYLRKLNYTYPYHQAIGYYLERAGVYKTTQVEMLREFPMDFDFYLTHKMGATDYVERWRLFVPKGF